MDTMNVKHFKCFAPLVADFFDIKDQTRFLEVWNNVNLYSKTRGTNRFKGLLFSFEKYGYQGNFSRFKQWVETAEELSNRSLQQEITRQSSSDLVQALAWSEAVNQAIKGLRGEDKPYLNVPRSLSFIQQFADIAIVSSANNQAILDEWQRHRLIDYTNYIYGQNEGSKARCLGLLKEKGYLSNHILMVGDSPGDLEAAQTQGVHFFPILCNYENESWDELVLRALGKLLSNEYDLAYQNQLVEKFNQNLTA
ncbi:HAD family hydrolase [Rodentibacter haemolyticus]|uniref:phosphoglycolate phosphatase n=2 Tax=Rodentibacter haemolyticus TaxID=2778911 RepID=A0ABX6V004_9PAST|nr:HAD family hydrolase [Rodentibacter haemolyticus]